MVPAYRRLLISVFTTAENGYGVHTSRNTGKENTELLT